MHGAASAPAATRRPANLKQALLAEAAALGFDAVNITVPEAIGPAGERLMAFLAQGRRGDMDWMETTAERRRDARALWPDVRSIVMLGLSYAPRVIPWRVWRPSRPG